MKLSTFTDKPFLILTQSPHGANQDYKAIDFGHLSGVAPAEGFIKYYYPQKNTQQNYFAFGKDNWYIQVVHTNPLAGVGQIVYKGKGLWRSTWHHAHIALNVEGKWYYILAAIDWTKTKVYWLKEGQSHPVWTKQSTYGSIELEPLPITNMEMVKLQQAIKVQVTATTNLNIRKEPSTSAGVTAQLNPNDIFETDQVASGSVVDGNATWYKHTQGWVSGRWLKEIKQGDCSEIQKQLDTANGQVTELTNVNTQLKQDNEKFKPAYDGAKLIQSVT